MPSDAFKSVIQALRRDWGSKYSPTTQCSVIIGGSLAGKEEVGLTILVVLPVHLGAVYVVSVPGDLCVASL